MYCFSMDFRDVEAPYWSFARRLAARITGNLRSAFVRRSHSAPTRSACAWLWGATSGDIIVSFGRRGPSDGSVLRGRYGHLHLHAVTQQHDFHGAFDRRDREDALQLVDAGHRRSTERQDDVAGTQS